MADNAIRPFQVNVPEAELTELRRRINATRWPEKELVSDHSQGVPLATMQKLARYWATEHDWRKVEARLNALPNFIAAMKLVTGESDCPPEPAPSSSTRSPPPESLVAFRQSFYGSLTA